MKFPAGFGGKSLTWAPLRGPVWRGEGQCGSWGGGVVLCPAGCLCASGGAGTRRTEAPSGGQVRTGGCRHGLATGTGAQWREHVSSVLVNVTETEIREEHCYNLVLVWWEKRRSRRGIATRCLLANL